MGDCEVVHQPMGKDTVTACTEMKIKGNSCLVGSSQNTFLTKSQAYLVQTLQFAWSVISSLRPRTDFQQRTELWSFAPQARNINKHAVSFHNVTTY